MKSINASQLQSRLEQNDVPVIIDVREPEEVAQGMIAGAIHIPLGEIPVRLHEIPQDRETVMVCRGGNRSKRAIEFLEEQGYTKLVNLEGGMMAWDQQ